MLTLFGWVFLHDIVGGNAGIAAAYSARQLAMPATIIIPESTPTSVADILRDEGANVIVHGKVSISQLFLVSCCIVTWVQVQVSFSTVWGDERLTAR